MVKIKLYKGDLPEDLEFGNVVAVDTETMGLKHRRDRLCVVQLCDGDGIAHLVQLDKEYNAPRLKALLSNTETTKIFHYARFDIAVIKYYMGIQCQPVYCTRTASKIARTYTDRHGLKDCCRELLSIEISKNQQSSDWGADDLTKEQMDYAARDVLHLHDLKNKLDEMLEREGRLELVRQTFDMLPVCAELDLAGYRASEIVDH